jgi:hypothetical protein
VAEPILGAIGGAITALFGAGCSADSERGSSWLDWSKARLDEGPGVVPPGLFPALLWLGDRQVAVAALCAAAHKPEP